ncbi:helix-turn-helix domain-containing protein [Streptomyces sp. NBC_01775]|uniref:helix-turn-helix domain-containing protein n=1 Tax=Streptomyces sp. NBC_01775 TaxID=2975939 RepID=UPI002DDBCAEE|nr:helix-turn-helix transcriptional regulator [Streptomyces sp. NBC_01775]WSB77125.1 helix-turn-helix domain-containing protein [Streptomyces sp. NBC_01775]
MGLRANPSQRQKRLGQELRRIREESGVNREAACRHAGLHKPHLSHIEAGRTACSETRLRALLDFYGCADTALVEALVDMSAASGRGWWSEYRELSKGRLWDLAELECGATAHRSFQWMFVPGLLQTRDYVSALFANSVPAVPPEDGARLAEFRLRRQSVLFADPPPRCHAVIHEAAFHMHFVSRKIRRAQLEYLVEISQLPQFTIQLLPFRSEMPPATPGAPFSLMDGKAAPLCTVYVEQPTTPAFISDPAHVEEFAATFSRLSMAAFDPLDSTLLHATSSYRLVQHLLYIL